MSKWAGKTVCIVDNGLFCGFGEVFAAAGFGKVYYVTPTASSFATTAEYSIGLGMPGVTRLPSEHDALARADEIDLWVFPDVYLGGLADFLRDRGARVWGSGQMELLELDRLKFKKHAEKLGLDVGPYEVVKGMTAVEEYIKSHSPCFLKTARHGPPGRGDFETLHCETWSLVRYELRDIRRRLGSRDEITEFIIEKPIGDAVELATDLYNVCGQFPAKGVLGIEIKSRSYVGHVVDYESYPKSLRDVNAKLAPTYKKFQYANFSPIECRLKKSGTAYVLDPCLRFGKPPLCVQTFFTNWPEIMWAGGEGELVEPKFEDKFVAEMCMESEQAQRLATPVHFPKELLPNVRLCNYTVQDGERIVVPQHYQVPGIGSVVASGPTLAKAIEACREAGKEIKALGLDVKDAFGDAEKEIETLAEFGVTF